MLSSGGRSGEGRVHLEKTGLLCTPGAAFGSLGEGHVRLALVQPPAVMEEIVQAVEAGGILR